MFIRKHTNSFHYPNAVDNTEGLYFFEIFCIQFSSDLYILRYLEFNEGIIILKFIRIYFCMLTYVFRLSSEEYDKEAPQTGVFKSD